MQPVRHRQPSAVGLGAALAAVTGAVVLATCTGPLASTSAIADASTSSIADGSTSAIADGSTSAIADGIVYSAGTDVPVLKMTASARAFQRCAAIGNRTSVRVAARHGHIISDLVRSALTELWPIQLWPIQLWPIQLWPIQLWPI